MKYGNSRNEGHDRSVCALFTWRDGGAVFNNPPGLQVHRFVQPQLQMDPKLL